MSRPSIALHKKSNVMKAIDNQYVKRTQKDYSMSFKLSIVDKVERGELSVTSAQKKYGIQGNATVIR